MSECLIQDRVLALLRQNHLTGFEVYPASARCEESWKGTPPKLWELRITGWAGMARPESGISIREACPACGHTEYTTFSDASLLIDESKWDGSDFFMVWPLPRFIFVTARAAKLLHTARVTGCGFRLPGDMEAYGDGLSPGRLSYWFDPETAATRAVEVGGFA